MLSDYIILNIATVHIKWLSSVARNRAKPTSVGSLTSTYSDRRVPIKDSEWIPIGLDCGVGLFDQNKTLC